MKRNKTKVLTQVSKISDFFAPKNVTDAKRKHADASVLNPVTNLPRKCSPEATPSCKKVKLDENHISSLGESPPRTGFKVGTPDKELVPSTSMKTPTPVKNRRTPQSGRKGTPKKLFEKSPKRVEEFNVQLLEAFVLSPSLSNKKPKANCTQRRGKTDSGELKRGSPAQNRNETTPTKSPKTPSFISPRAKTRLSFLDSVDASTKKEPMEEDLDVKLENRFFEDEFDSLLSFEDAFSTLDLQKPVRCTVVDVDRSDRRVVLKLESCQDGRKGKCVIEEFWSSAKFKVGDSVYINAEKNGDGWIVNNEKGLIVYEPDLLIPCTWIVGSLFCKRKTVLSDFFRGFEGSNRIMVVGVLTHTLLQQALKKKLTTTDEMRGLMKGILKSKDTAKKLYEADLTLDDIESELEIFLPKVVTFVQEYVTGESRPESSNWQGQICDVDDIEENLWCPELGIKGKIDVTVNSGPEVKPLELKTGRATISLEHRGQVVLYVMMMNKFGYKVSSGLLLYLREGVLREVKASPQEMRDVMILRNELAYFLTRGVESGGVGGVPELPEPLNNHRVCSKCVYNVICTTYLKHDKQDISHNKSIQDVQKNATSHLTQSHCDYFLLWSNLLGMEANSNKSSKSIKKIYTMTPDQRESLSGCIINMTVTGVGEDQNGLYEHTFEKKDSCGNLVAFEIVENNYVVVSTDERPAVATGFVTQVSATNISILLDRNLQQKYPQHLFHIDTYESNITYTFNMTSLALILEDTPRAAELRDIIIDKKPPTFAAKLPSVVAKKGVPILKRLNPVQQRAVLKALCANEFLLIKGMPGTGKSATIVALIQLLRALNKSVLITSHTHSAIDNICKRLQERSVDFLRLGSDSKIDPSLKPHSEMTLTKDCTTPEQLEEMYNKHSVIAVTCLGSGHPLLSKRKVDVCIVDESTQVLQTSMIRPLHAAKTFVLIGDPQQLAPVVKNRNAAEAGMSESLFERLENSEGMITLNLNYRMNRTITDLANVLTYGGELKTATEEVAQRVLLVPHLQAVKDHYKDHPWLLKSLDTSLEAAVQLIDTGPVWQLSKDAPFRLKNFRITESYDAQNYINEHEIAIVVTLVEALIMGGVASGNIGVIATYRAQVALLSQYLDKKNVDVSTVDQFQGRDKSVIVYSCTKSADGSKGAKERSKLELLEDKRRLTVAITRAKRKLLIVGDVSTLQRLSTFSIILPALKKNTIQFDASWSLFNHL